MLSPSTVTEFYAKPSEKGFPVAVSSLARAFQWLCLRTVLRAKLFTLSPKADFHSEIPLSLSGADIVNQSQLKFPFASFVGKHSQAGTPDGWELAHEIKHIPWGKLSGRKYNGEYGIN